MNAEAQELKGRLSALEARVAELEQRHTGRLDGHDEAIADLRKTFARIESDVSRIFGVLTTQALVMERVDKGMVDILAFVIAAK